jgi:hypothetical protein
MLHRFSRLFLRCARLEVLNDGRPRTKSGLYNCAAGPSADMFLMHIIAARDAADHDAARLSCRYQVYASTSAQTDIGILP